MELDEEIEEEGNPDDIQVLSEDTSAASALLMLSRAPPPSHQKSHFKPLWEGTYTL